MSRHSLARNVGYVLAELEDVRAKGQRNSNAITQIIADFVWRPGAGGGALPQNVFTDFPTPLAGFTKLYNAVRGVSGASYIECDNVFTGGNPVEIPANTGNAPWNLRPDGQWDVTLIGNGRSSSSGANGTDATLHGPISGIGNFTLLDLFYDGVAAPAISIVDQADFTIPQFVVKNAFIATLTAQPFIQTNGTVGCLVSVDDADIGDGVNVSLAARDTTILAVNFSNGGWAVNSFASDPGALLEVDQFSGELGTVIMPAVSGGTIMVRPRGLLSMSRANRVTGRVQANAGVAPGAATRLFAADLAVTRQANAQAVYRVKWAIPIANATAGDQTLSILAAAAGGGLASVLTQTITVAANNAKTLYCGEAVFDGSPGFALLPQDGTGGTIVNAAVTAGAGNFTTLANAGWLFVEEIGS